MQEIKFEVDSVPVSTIPKAKRGTKGMVAKKYLVPLVKAYELEKGNSLVLRFEKQKDALNYRTGIRNWCIRHGVNGFKVTQRTNNVYLYKLPGAKSPKELLEGMTED